MKRFFSKIIPKPPVMIIPAKNSRYDYKEAGDNRTTVESYACLKTEQVRCLDQFIFRFSKLQDAIGAKIFRYTLELLDENTSVLPMRDILNRLERYLIIPSANEWNYIRELRNEISHDYPLLETDTVAILNELLSKVAILFGIYDKLKEYFQEN